MDSEMARNLYGEFTQSLASLMVGVAGFVVQLTIDFF